MGTSLDDLLADLIVVGHRLFGGDRNCALQLWILQVKAPENEELVQFVENAAPLPH
jgi:hypothetical protein